MNRIVKWRWIIALLWIAVLVGLNVTGPDMGKLVREKGQIRIPDGLSSSIAADLTAKSSPKHSDKMSIVLVFHDQKGITDADMAAIKQELNKLQDEKAKLNIADITSFLTDERLKDELISKDNKTILTLLSVYRNGREVSEIRDSLKQALADIPVEHYLTGASLVNEDVVLSSEQGLKRTEWITVVFILLVLILVFRSPVAPFIPLLTVGVTYVVSLRIVAYLVDLYGFPLSTFTQIFLVAVLFGIGTDYCILLLSRFKEELADHGNVNEAIIDTYRTAGRTVIFSGLAAFAGFASIGLAKFNLYQSAAAVAVGVLVLMVALMTIVPLFMKVLGKRLFWPVRG
ncbi:MAG TPA: MMPL family transporter, partial [Bacilli bacterium]